MEDGTGIIRVVAETVRRARKAAGLSQEDLALEAGVDRTYISQVERGKRNVTIVVLARIAKALKTTPDRLLVSGKKGKA
ncbi:helix-turn-helix domain-containing protein [Bradyrhizobium australiense]|uniref:Helix-turn-helix transcriptional regulator n=1 Tax=Bradyrhizobium australiense TaxID=2721161 RepID=A0A7Y4LW76_9BRAD|nr:helix-turn-helix transcriptional regulator [Bradyrhizobium australiense]NOJ40906.1 helix-turn-helix transcriptional regulator [Bradyrhizobium australiense]